MTSPTIAIVGAGPIGIETALYALGEGYDVDLYEQDRPGAHVERWDHVRFFSPWSMNQSPWGQAVLAQTGHPTAEAADFPTGRQYLDTYLLPLATTPPVAACLHEASRVAGVSRRHARKGEYIGDKRRADSPFLLRIDDSDGQHWAEADLVIDTTGVYGQPGHLGPGGLPALGEGDAEAFIEHGIPDPLGTDRSVYTGRSTLVVGNGFSAATSARLLAELCYQSPDTGVVWLVDADTPPYQPIADDRLPGRRALATFGNRASRGEVDAIEPVVGQLRRLSRSEDALVADISGPQTDNSVQVDRVVGNVGYRPDANLYRELQVHQCYASEAPMKLAAYLLSQDDAGGDCLEQTSGGFETLTSPEPNFYILGSKSYGRNSDFLLQLGFEQIEQVFDEGMS